MVVDLLRPTEDIAAWQKHHSSNIFLAKSKDELGLDIVCSTGRPLAYNKHMHFFHKIAFNRALSKMESLSGKIVLDVGCGAGRWSKMFRNLGANVHGIDISEKRIQENKSEMKDINFEFMSITDLKFDDDYFDVVNSVTVLQHIPFDLKEKAITEIARVIKKNGKVLLIEGVNDTKLTSKTSFIYNTDGWINIFEKNGFRLIFTEKHLDMIPTDMFISLDNNFRAFLRKRIGITIQEQNNLFDVTHLYSDSEERIDGRRKRFRILRSLYRNLSNFLLIIITYGSYLWEYLNFYILKRYNWHTGTFLFEKL